MYTYIHVPISIVFSIPGTLLAKQFLPSSVIHVWVPMILDLTMCHSHSIACGAFIWSVAVTGMAGSQTFGAIITSRLFIGIGEAMFGQAVALHYSLWYKKDEIAKRLALFIGSGVLAGAYVGLSSRLSLLTDRGLDLAASLHTESLTSKAAFPTGAFCKILLMMR